ncbi:MAG: sulfur transferase domain-containing protein [Steroidobacteraceae bacterium]
MSVKTFIPLIAMLVFHGLAARAAPSDKPAMPAAVQQAPAATSVALLKPRPGLFTAGQPAASDWSVLASQGVHTVVNLRTASEMQGRDELAEVRSAGMRYVEIPIDGIAGITAENAGKLAAVLHETGDPVLVHCASANRAGGLLALVMAQQGMSTEAALEFGRKAGMKSTESRVREVLEEQAGK